MRLNSLVEEVAVTPLNTIEFGRLSIAALQYLLFYTYEKYSAILTAKQVSNDAYKTLMEQLPTLEQLGLLVEYIDFRQISAQILDGIIKPLQIISTEIILNVDCQFRILRNSNL